MTEIIVLEKLNRLPGGAMKQASPLTQDEAIQWAEKVKAPVVWYWGKTKSAFLQVAVSSMSAR